MQPARAGDGRDRPVGGDEPGQRVADANLPELGLIDARQARSGRARGQCPGSGRPRRGERERRRLSPVDAAVDSSLRASPESCDVLLVEDDPSLLDFLAELLTGDGLQVARARTAIEALALLESGPLPAILVTDIHL